MSYQQIAKLYLRGSLCNDKLKNLPQESQQEIEDIIELVSTDPLLQQCQKEFCLALSRTIKNEYLDLDVGKQDFRIAVMRAAIAAKVGYGKKAPAPETFTNPIQRKKWYQNWVFNYLRQILRENKIATKKISTKTNKVLEDALLSKIQSLLITIKPILIEDISNGYKLIFNTFLIPPEALEEIHALKDDYKENMCININNNYVELFRTGDVVFEVVEETKNMSIKEHSFDADKNEEPNRDNIESTANKFLPEKENYVEKSEMFLKLDERLPDIAKPILNIFIDEVRPQEYIDKYGPGQPKIAHISEFLCVSPREVKKSLGIIKLHLKVLQLGY